MTVSDPWKRISDLAGQFSLLSLGLLQEVIDGLIRHLRVACAEVHKALRQPRSTVLRGVLRRLRLRSLDVAVHVVREHPVPMLVLLLFFQCNVLRGQLVDNHRACHLLLGGAHVLRDDVHRHGLEVCLVLHSFIRGGIHHTRGRIVHRHFLQRSAERHGRPNHNEVLKRVDAHVSGQDVTCRDAHACLCPFALQFFDHLERSRTRIDASLRPLVQKVEADNDVVRSHVRHVSAVLLCHLNDRGEGSTHRLLKSLLLHGHAFLRRHHVEVADATREHSHPAERLQSKLCEQDVVGLLETVGEQRPRQEGLDLLDLRAYAEQRLLCRRDSLTLEE
eukprot:Rhum_TRINITY_DN7930_c0_g1::Rhum_TRINITY_DN7930_c0_g1_i1::g.25254::m.25254